MSSHSLGICNIELLTKCDNDVTSLTEAKVFLIIISATTYISKSVEYASEVLKVFY
jgi:GTP cyclohydrolase II